MFHPHMSKGDLLGCLPDITLSLELLSQMFKSLPYSFPGPAPTNYREGMKN